jgi:hypothetical protein
MQPEAGLAVVAGGLVPWEEAREAVEAAAEKVASCHARAASQAAPSRETSGGAAWPTLASATPPPTPATDFEDACSPWPGDLSANTSALVQSTLRCPGRKQRKQSPAIPGDGAPQPVAPASFRASIWRVHCFPFEGLGCSQTRRSCTLARSSGRAVFLGSGRGATLSPDEAEERPSPETCSLRRGDAEEADALPSVSQRREKPGG